MQFDVVIMNPPYHSKSSASHSKTQAIWDKFVKKAFVLVEENGIVVAVHPSGWRNHGGAFKEAHVLREKQIEYLEIHDEQDGQKTFHASTRYDWYVARNTPCAHESIMVGQDGECSRVDLQKLPVIPNCMIDKISSMLARDEEETVGIICDSTYHTQRDHMSRERNDKFKYSIVYSTPVASPTIWWSSIQNGHFGTPKVIFNPSCPIGFVVDYNGEYGISQFCVGIVGDKNYLDMVEDVIANQKTNGFAEFMEACHFTDKIFNKDIFSSFRRDFWREFV